MKKRSWIYTLLALVVSAALGVMLWPSSITRPIDGKEDQKQQTIAPPTSASALGPIVNNALGEVLSDFFRKAGFQQVAPARGFLTTETASGDKGRIHRAFQDIVYSRGWKMSEAVPAMKPFLKDPDPFVRYSAAEALFIAGDHSGYSTLLDLVRSDNRIEGVGQDVRIYAAETLAKFRQKDAIDAITELYLKTHSAELSEALSQLGAQLPGETKFPFVTDYHTIVQYARTNDTWFIPQINSVFQSSTKPELRNSAAWALATMTSDPSAINYLIQSAQPAIRGQTLYANARQVIEYLGSIPSPEAKQALEAALDSPSQTVVEVATVNLLFNQGGSEKAKQVVTQQFEGKRPISRQIGVDLAFRIAAALDNDPEIQAAGQAYIQRTHNAELWQAYVVERRNWPIYNWIDDYVVKLNR